MKKILAVVLSLCMLFGCVGFAANGGRIHTTVTYQGQSLADLLAEFGYDTDGCTQLSLSGQVQQQMLDLFFQIGQNSLVVGSGEELYEITSEALGQAVANIAKDYIGEENMAMIGAAIGYFTQGGFEADKPILTYVLQNEVMRIAGIAQQNGIVTVAEDGTVTIEADEAALQALVAAYLADLAKDDNAFARISSTQLWALLKLSEGGVQEKAILSQLAAQVAQANLGVKFYVLAVILPTGSFDLTLTLADEATVDLSVKAGYAENIFVLDLTEAVNGVSLSLVADTEDKSISYAVVTPEAEVNAVINIGDNGAVSMYETALANTGNGWVKAEVEETVDPSNVAFSYSALIDFGADKDSLERVANINVSFDMQNFLRGEAYIVPMNTTFSLAAYPESNGFTAYLDVAPNGEAAKDLFRLEVKAGAQIEAYAVLRNYDFSTAEITDIFELEASVDLATAAVEGVLALGDGRVFVLTGAIDENAVYTLTLSMNGMEMAVASLAIDPERGLGYSLLMGDLIVKLYDGTEITRTTELTDDALTMTINVTKNGQTQTYTAGLRPIREESDIVGYELFLGNGQMEYVLGFLYHTSDSKFDFQAYLKLVAGPSEMEMGRVTFEYEEIDVPGAHVTGTELPAEQVEQILRSLIDSLQNKLTTSRVPAVYDYGYGA